MKKYNILLVVRWPVGGIRTFIRYVYRNFDSERWRLTILAPDISEMRVLLADLAGLDVGYIPVEEGPSAARFFLKVSSEIIKGGYDLVHSQGFTSGICTVLPAVLSRTPHLMTSHDVINEKQFTGMKGKVKKEVIGRLFSLIDTIHSVSYDAQENLLEHFPTLGRRDGKCIVIPNGIEVERFFDAAPRDLRGELGLEEDVFLIGFLGRFMAQKGFRYLVDAVDLLRAKEGLAKRPLVLTFGYGAFIREEKQAIEERGLKDFFRFMPFTPNIAGTIKGLDVVAMPSLWEACPLQPMEALVCGTPIIGTDCIGSREVLKDTPATIVPKGDSIALADALLLEMISSRKKEFLAFRNESKERFDVRHQTVGLQRLIQKIVASQG